MQGTTFLNFWFKAQPERRAQQQRLNAARKRVVLVASLLCAASSLFFVHSPKAITGVIPAPVATVSPALPQGASRGQGSGGIAGNNTDVRLPTVPALCNPFDSTCFADSLSSWAAGHIQDAFQPITDGILGNPADIVYQTPPEDSYQNPTILAINAVFIGVVDTALASLLVIGAYNAMLGSHLNLLRSSITELLPRAILVVGAVHFNLFFLGLFIDFENNLSLAVIHAASYTMLTNLIKGLFTGSSTIGGLIAFVLLIVLGIMVLFLLVQMVTRLALVAISLALAPLGLGCFILPQTIRWGRLWLTTLSSAVLVQALQVIALGLAGSFITAIASTSLVRLDQKLATLFLAIGTMLLVLKIPGMLQTWALHPMMDGTGNWGSGSGQSGQEISGGSGGAGGGDMFASDMGSGAGAGIG
ncbi:MAG: hypothetical protein ACRDHW_12560, partial [Ktedonobacteraceae bacterium]